MGSIRKLPEGETLSFNLKDKKEPEHSPVLKEDWYHWNLERKVERSEKSRWEGSKRSGFVAHVKYLNINFIAIDSY